MLAIVILFVGSFVMYSLLSQQKRTIAPTVLDTPQPEAPQLQASLQLEGLDHPWDIAFLPDKTLIFTERSGAISKKVANTKVSLLAPDDVVARGEGGMLGMAVDPKFSDNRYIYACFNSDRERLDVRVARFKVDTAVTSLNERKDIVTGIPANTNGRHSGCRIDFGPDGNLWIGTGDAAQANTPQNQQNLGGKILRVDRDGKGVEGNLGGTADPRVFSYGHRNTQGLVFFDKVQNGSYGYSAEHGPDRDDEINPLRPGNFGWAPGTGYNESVPMTDTEKFPDAVPATWSSGDSTIAISDVAFLSGKQWGIWDGRLVVAVLKDKHLRLITLKNEKVVSQQTLFDDTYGRLRAAVLGPDGALYFTTDNGTEDAIIKVTSSF